jgi:hypothetical protein
MYYYKGDINYSNKEKTWLGLVEKKRATTAISARSILIEIYLIYRD